MRKSDLSFQWKAIGQTVVHNRIFFSLLSFNALFYISGSTFAPYIATYYKSQGIPVAQIGILTAAGPMISLLLQPAWGMLSDKAGRHMLFLRVAIAGSMAMVLTFYLANGFPLFLLSASLYAMFNCAIQPLGDTIVVKQVTERGYKFSAVRMGGTVGYAVTVVAAGAFLKQNASLSFGITSGVLLLILAVTFVMPKDHARRVKRKLEPGRLFRDKTILFIMFYAVVFQIAMGYYGSFFGVFVTDLGYDNGVIGWMMCISASSEIPVLLTIDRLLKRFRTETLLLAAGFFLVLRMLLPLTGTLIGLIAAQSLQGLTYMIMYYSTVMYMNNHLDDDLRGTGQSMLCMVQSGLACLFSNILGGVLGQTLGLHSTYLIYALALLAVTLVCVAVMRRKANNTRSD